MNLTSIKKNLEKKILETTSKISANFIALDGQKKNIVDATLSIIQALKKKKKFFFVEMEDLLPTACILQQS